MRLFLGMILGALLTGGFWFRPKSVSALMDDEVTRENRHRALSLGFGLAMATAIGLFLIDRFEPLAAPVAIQLILSVGLGTALVRFAVLEKRALG